MCRTALALGTFDGLHTAHRQVLALADGCENKIALTFDVPPAMVLKNQCELIISADKKEKMLKELGFSAERLDFSAVRNIEPYDFLNYIKDKYKPDRICCGFNYRFGKNGAGDIALLSSFCKEQGIELCVADAVDIDGARVSSSRIRELIRRGEIIKANELLSYPFSLEGKVTHGDGRGRTMKHPTINFPYPEKTIMARHGVYSSRCIIDGVEYRAVTYIGTRPTYLIDGCICETNILDFTGDLYGRTLCVGLCEFLRDDRKFASKDELKAQIELDIKMVMEK